MGKILKAQSVDMEFADFKCAGIPYANTPDSILMTKNAQLKMVGELKVPWVDEHNTSKAYDNEQVLRHFLAQPIKYKKDLNCMYGFMSNLPPEPTFHTSISLWDLGKDYFRPPS